jgi:hypothetical protein
VTPVVITAGGRDFLLCFGLNAYALPDGAKTEVVGWKNHGATMLVKYDEPDVVFFTGGGEHGGWENKGKCEHPPPAAVKFSLDGGRLVAEVLWSGIDGKAVCEHAGTVYHAGKLYHPAGVILDALTGKVVKGSTARNTTRAVPVTRHLMWVADGKLYGLTAAKPGRQKDGAEGGVAQVYDLDGRKLVESVLAVPAPDAAKRARIIEACGAAGWGFSYGCPFTIAGDRLYIRSNDCLFCVGEQAARR